MKRFKYAFTLLELIIVIVVIGILATAILSRRKDNSLQEAALQLISDIRYTQHLALTDDKYDPRDSEYHKGRWQIVFSNSRFSDNQPAYTIFSDKDFGHGYSGDPTKTEIAKNIMNHDRLMTGGYGTSALDIKSNSFKGNKKLNLGKTYGITNVSLSNGCHYARLSFDHMGRPMTGDQSTMYAPYKAGSKRLLVKKRCEITLTSYTSETLKIAVEPETGYAHIIN
jgi:prepilin-type N-terminal cleavage/methylation domain-containing protein